MDELYRWLWVPIVGLASTVFAFSLNSRKRDNDEMFKRLRKVENNFTKLDAQVQPILITQHDLMAKLDKIMDIVTDIRVQAEKNKKTGTSYLQDT